MKIEKDKKTGKLVATCPFTLELFEAEMLALQYNTIHRFDNINYPDLFMVLEMDNFLCVELTLISLGSTGWEWTTLDEQAKPYSASYTGYAQNIKDTLMKNRKSCNRLRKNSYKLYLYEDHTISHCYREDGDCNVCYAFSPEKYNLCNKSRVSVELEEGIIQKNGVCKLCGYKLEPLFQFYYCPLCD